MYWKLKSYDFMLPFAIISKADNLSNFHNNNNKIRCPFLKIFSIISN